MPGRRRQRRTDRSKLDATPPWETRVHEEPEPTTGPYDERDPLVGPCASADERRDFTVTTGPQRARLQGLGSYVVVRGGAYFFLPGLRALRYLTTLRS